MCFKLPLRRFVFLPALAITCAALLAACGGGGSDDSGDTSTPSTPVPASDVAAIDPQEAAQALATCALGAGLEGSVVDGEVSGAAGVDLTTKHSTIIVEVFSSPDAAGGYESGSGLDQELISNAVILGGAIPEKSHDIIVGCLPASD